MRLGNLDFESLESFLEGVILREQDRPLKQLAIKNRLVVFSCLNQ